MLERTLNENNFPFKKWPLATSCLTGQKYSIASPWDARFNDILDVRQKAISGSSRSGFEDCWTVSHPAYQRCACTVVRVFTIEQWSFWKMAAPGMQDGVTLAQSVRLKPNGKFFQFQSNAPRPSKLWYTGRWWIMKTLKFSLWAHRDIQNDGGER